MVLIGNFFFCIGVMGVTGSIGYLLLFLFQKGLRRGNPRFMLTGIKTVILLYLLPIVYLIMRIRRIQYLPDRFVAVSEFGIGTTGELTDFGYVISLIWFAGLLVGIGIRIRQYLKWRNVQKGSVPVEDETWKSLCFEYQEKYSVSSVCFYQNDLLKLPVVTRDIRPMILLPFCHYSEKQMRMMMEHEMNHIRNHDLLWKKIGLLMTWLHWINPLVYLVLDRLRLEEEMECDIRACQESQEFSAREYAGFLAEMDESESSKIFAATLYYSKKDVERRIEGMKQRGRFKKPGKWMAVAGGIALMLAAAVPSYAMSEKAADAQEEWLQKTEEREGQDTVDWSGELIVYEVTDDGSVTEIVAASEAEAYSSNVILDYTIKPGTRILFKSQTMQVGDKVWIAANCNDSDAVYRIGIKNMLLNKLYYVEGTGSLMHTFEVTEAGTYRVIVENCSDVEIDVTGMATYPY